MSALRIGRCIGQRGTSALEFAMLAPIVITLALVTIEFGYQAAIASALDFGARAAGRTGVTGGGYNPVTEITQRQASLRSAVLAASGGMLQDNRLTMGEKSYNTVAEAQADPFGTDVTKGIPGPGGPQQYVRYTLSYVQDLLTGKWVGDVIGRTSFTYTSTVLVTNEPYPIN